MRVGPRDRSNESLLSYWSPGENIDSLGRIPTHDPRIRNVADRHP